MVKTLADAGLLDYEPRGGVRLTSNGEKLALHVLRRHRLVELFLVEVLGLDWSEVDDEAEELEHAISDKVLEAHRPYLGNPRKSTRTATRSPPAPASSLKRHLRPLASCTPGEKAAVAVIADQAPDFLTYARLHGLTPGATLTLKFGRPHRRLPHPLQRHVSKLLTLGHTAAAKVFVK
jgi:DtxR family Mn-dependent transcriptional regulator